LPVLLAHAVHRGDGAHQAEDGHDDAKTHRDCQTFNKKKTVKT
jgi:hypothetical protein